MEVWKRDGGAFECTKDGVLHREDGPAVICDAGHKMWYKNGKLHRDGGPAVIYANNSEKWYKDGVLHRMVELDNPLSSNGPAATYYTPGGMIYFWGINGVKYTEEEYMKIVRETRSSVPTKKHSVMLDGVIHYADVIELL